MSQNRNREEKESGAKNGSEQKPSLVSQEERKDGNRDSERQRREPRGPKFNQNIPTAALMQSNRYSIWEDNNIEFAQNIVNEISNSDNYRPSSETKQDQSHLFIKEAFCKKPLRDKLKENYKILEASVDSDDETNTAA